MGQPTSDTVLQRPDTELLQRAMERWVPAMGLRRRAAEPWAQGMEQLLPDTEEECRVAGTGMSATRLRAGRLP
jgi:hypothetical protein